MSDTAPPPLDPVPQRVAGQDLVRGETVERAVAARPVADTIENIRVWLTGAARVTPSLAQIVDELSWRLLAAGLPVLRVSLGITTLHPQFLGATYVWWHSTGRTVEVMIAYEIGERVPLDQNPVMRVRERGETIRRSLEVADARLDFPVLHELKERGGTDFLALPVPSVGGRQNYLAYVGDRPGGFADEEIAQLTSIAEPLAVAADWFSQRLIAANVLNAYLGPITGPRVLAGQIRRGTGDEIAAVLWSSDLRDFTRFSDRLPGARVIAVLDHVFDLQAKAIERHGGEILKFVGDGLLAIFPISTDRTATVAASEALAAAAEAQTALAELDGDGASLRMVVALHYGTVIYGNIGAAQRLDFTVIGPAVNLVSRIEMVAKSLDLPVVVSDDFAAISGRKLRSLGLHRLRGLDQPHELFAPEAPTGRDK
ncbi:MAG TPA: adenylate/guanylate cyclase domain-containing protein [Stellaceae bacterium]|jgi:adenylate cyclase